MPLINNSKLPSFTRLAEDGFTVLPSDRAMHQDIRELHIGLLNMMPDGALEATERQFLRLITSCNTIAQFYVHIFSLPSIERGDAAQKHIDEHYETFESIKAEGLDALIITGANPAKPNLYEEAFWPEMMEVFQWAEENTVSTLCSCLASHAAFKLFYNIDRIPLEKKCWGVFSHKVKTKHPLINNVNTRFDVPHSRFNTVNADQLRAVGLDVLVESEAVGFHLATSTDGFRVIYLQGHSEYNRNSLLKEYKREIHRFYLSETDSYPPLPANYFSSDADDIVANYCKQVTLAKANGQPLPIMPEAEMLDYIDNTWWDSGKAIFNNWLGLVYQLTNVDRSKVFMDGVDPKDPLQIRNDNS